MRSNPLFRAFVVCVFLTTFLYADCANDQDHRSNKNSGLLITDFTITGTLTLSSDELATIASKLTGSCFDENSEELEERVRLVFQNQGYFAAVVKSLRIKPSDQLAIPKPTTLEAEVLEGQRYKLSEIRFTGNRAFGAAKLRREFPLKRGDLFEKDKIAGGIDGIRKLYAADGFVDWLAIPDTQPLSDATIILSLSIAEGPQYRMGKLEIFAQKEMADRLREEWQLADGAVFDFSYVDKYVVANRSLLPLGFTPRDVQLVRDCPGASIEVRLVLEVTDPSSQSRPKDVECEPPNSASK